MRVFVTGATGWVGTALVKELLSNGYSVLGLSRSEAGVQKLEALGATPHLGDVNSEADLAYGIANSDAVIHTAFNHDMTQYKANCEADRRVIEIMGRELAGSGKPLVITSGIGILHYDRIFNEDDALTSGSGAVPRAATEEAANAVAATGVEVYIVRLPPSVHGAGDHGFVPYAVSVAKEKGQAAYVGNGANLWPTVHRFDAAAIYRLILDKRPEQKIFHAIAEDGVPFGKIAEAIGNGLGLEVVSKTGEDAAAYFGWFTHFAGLNCMASAEKTKEILGWQPKETDLISDITANYLD
ncbi:3-beta hydroxysteroid dehydrogenase [Flavobacterium akiainvivens]|uniref:3-beta hydroxysteroid dehydrogenase n=1 Tax=Flavobacterium akiainvivens TaxID=1202724 RepID=A0A0M8MG04_9FLAO|nr:SDR family oxidoreductase [Flavobacterium akiainvivens]KOS08104.1 3-beta hydroxysteroid dehydrogenase [Flavobacterium akiainvivens]SFQ71907.1 Nucleoside-diphosphate-sugar epimerase [Flavobacterium akiainvivens]